MSRSKIANNTCRWKNTIEGSNLMVMTMSLAMKHLSTFNILKNIWIQVELE